VLIRQHLAIFQAEFEQLLIKERDDDLGRMYTLCEHVDGAFEKLREILEKHVENKGRTAIDSVATTAIQVHILVYSSFLICLFLGSQAVCQRHFGCSQSVQ
jgi:hypothetical protein